MDHEIGIKNIILNPANDNQLAKIYENAIKNAKELYIASAYLTSWSTKIPLNPKCENILFLIGTDFGITRKQACSNVVKWLPKRFQENFQAVPVMSNKGFHPKIVAWKDFRNNCFCIIGSSNLTEAAFNTNYEANIKVSITENEFIEIKNWLEGILLKNGCQIVDESWIKEYKEKITNKKGGKHKEERVINLLIPNNEKYKKSILLRRKNEKTFIEIKKKLQEDIIACSEGRITNKEFWGKFVRLWWKHKSRIQGSGIQFTGKNANWKQVCKAFLRVIDIKEPVNELTLDLIVKREIDDLYKLKNPMRGSWFSEMLCHFLPSYYPLLDKPVKIYLKQNKWKSQRGLSEGSKYIVLAKKLRDVIKQNPNGPKNMPELDAAIYTWCDERDLIRGEYGK